MTKPKSGTHIPKAPKSGELSEQKRCEYCDAPMRARYYNPDLSYHTHEQCRERAHAIHVQRESALAEARRAYVEREVEWQEKIANLREELVAAEELGNIAAALKACDRCGQGEAQFCDACSPGAN